jgi:hypothetical protein
MMKPGAYKIAVISLLIFAVTVSVGPAASQEEVPEALARWRAWVLHGYEEELCPVNYNDRTAVRCQWPSRLQISVSNEGGEFEQSWQLFAPGWVALPGDMDIWPDSVAADGSSIAVINRDGVASIYLSPGTHRVKGRFAWQRLPELIHVPPAIGLLSLMIDGRTVKAPQIDEQGRLWLTEQQSVGDQTERLNAQIFRLIDDAIPMRVITVARLDVSGQAREVRLDGILLQNAVPMRIQSSLPVLIDEEGSLFVQVRPGRWELRLAARYPDPVHKISYGQMPYGNEIWSFQPRHHLRMVEISGVDRVEPGQTEMPAAWRRLPAYMIKPGSTLVLKELRRGDPQPAPDQLELHRRMWLDFNGRGFTLQDEIRGTLSRNWSIAVNAPMVLGRVAIDGREQVITAQGGLQRAGVQLRQGHLNLLAEARLEKRSEPITAVGWDHDFEKVSVTLNLPPGWRLLAAAGVDRVSDTWFQRWSLMDFFLVLLIALAVYKLRDWRWGLLALGAMVMTFQEPGAPRLVWLHILAVLALSPLLPHGWMKRLITIWGMVAVVVLLIIAIPFLVNQVRWGVYPQLAPVHDQRTGPGVWSQKKPLTDAPAKQSRPSTHQAPPASKKPLPSAPGKRYLAETQDRVSQPAWQHDPDAMIPTGPGLPDWTWHAVDLQWNGPVTKDQRLHLYLLSPWLNLVLALLRVALLSFLVWGLFDWRPWWSKIRRVVTNAGLVGVAVLAISGVHAVPVQASDGAFPPTELLDALRERLLAPADCLPYCADFSRLELAVSDDEMQIMLKAHAASTTAVPLPVNRNSWTPEQILLDNAPISGLARDAKGTLWAVVPSGLHTIVLLGSVAQLETVHIPLLLNPHSAAYTAEGWTAKGILPDGSVGSSIQLTRISPKHQRAKATIDSSALSPFLRVTRQLHLGMSWQVHTTVNRVTPIGAPVVANVPLLAGESMTTAGLHVDQNQVLINMLPEQKVVHFTSTLKIRPRIRLTAPNAVPWTETWILNASPIWHCEFSGLVAIHHQDDNALWQPQWQPWPGESLTIDISRPQALDGQTVTIHQALLKMTPGRRHGQGELALKIRTSHGGQHTIELPSRANLQAIQIDKQSLPVQQDRQWVTFPLQPGDQDVLVTWTNLTPFNLFQRVPVVEIGEKAVNATVRINMPPKRWILLTGGPRWGPAVLFWSYLVVIALAAFGLGKISLAPLKGWQWLLLGLGLTQVPVVMSLIVVAWLLAMGLKEKKTAPLNWVAYNAVQIGFIGLSIAGLVCLFAAVQAGLIGQPEMQIAGNRSTAWVLNWTQDRVATQMPQPWVFSLPLWVYRCLMLAWSLWLALALLAWLKWGWQCFSKDGLWRKMEIRSKQPKPAKSEQPQ